MLQALSEVEAQLPALLIVSAVDVEDLSGFTGERALDGDIEVTIGRAPGGKCQRCWNYSPSVGAHPGTPDICGRCVSALEALGR
jgi:isoleucyl-tRNA synthetase